MREILFKAKRIDNGEWICGNLLQTDEDGVCIIQNYVPHNLLKQYEINPDTICQYTGLTDKNGQKIWENDIVAYWDTYSTENGYAEADCVGKVVWDNETLSFQVTGRLSAESYEVLDGCVIIGNIFDNPELLSE